MLAKIIDDDLTKDKSNPPNIRRELIGKFVNVESSFGIYILYYKNYRLQYLTEELEFYAGDAEATNGTD